MVRSAHASHPADLAVLEGKLGYAFRNRGLLELALTHSSSTVAALTDNERLEFLGDAVLALSVNEHLYRIMPGEPEGELTRIKSAVVSTVTLARVARRLGLAEFMRLGKGLGDRAALPDSVHANVTEAVLAAIYLDTGLEPAKVLVIRLLEPEIAEMTAAAGRENAKSQIQELAQRRFRVAPRYRVLRESGPQHEKTFMVAVEVKGRTFPEFSAHTKKEAEQGAARLALEALQAERAPAARPARPAARPAPAAAPQAAAKPAGKGRRRRGRRGGGRKATGARQPGPAARGKTRPQPSPKPPAPAAPAPRIIGARKIRQNPYDMLGA